MPKQNPFVDHVLELLTPMGEVRARAMFGGYGVYRGDLTIGIVVDDTLYLKVDDDNRADFEAVGSGPFVYDMKGKPMTMSYYRAPEDAMDDQDRLCQWAESAYAAAVRAKQTAPPKRKRNR
jgi:DNA transformation protein and related proteins